MAIDNAQLLNDNLKELTRVVGNQSELMRNSKPEDRRAASGVSDSKRETREEKNTIYFHSMNDHLSALSKIAYRIYKVVDTGFSKVISPGMSRLHRDDKKARDEIDDLFSNKSKTAKGKKKGGFENLSQGARITQARILRDSRKQAAKERKAKADSEARETERKNAGFFKRLNMVYSEAKAGRTPRVGLRARVAGAATATAGRAGAMGAMGMLTKALGGLTGGFIAFGKTLLNTGKKYIEERQSIAEYGAGMINTFQFIADTGWRFGMNVHDMAELMGKNKVFFTNVEQHGGNYLDILEETSKNMSLYTRTLKDATQASASNIKFVHGLGVEFIDTKRAAKDQREIYVKGFRKFGMTVKDFDQFRKSMINTSEVEFTLATAKEDERESIANSITAQAELSMELGHTSEQAARLATQFSKFSKEDPLTRIQKSVKLGVLAGQMGINSSDIERFRAIAFKGTRADDAEKKFYNEFLRTVSNKTVGAIGQQGTETFEILAHRLGVMDTIMSNQSETAKGRKLEKTAAEKQEEHWNESLEIEKSIADKLDQVRAAGETSGGFLSIIAGATLTGELGMGAEAAANTLIGSVKGAADVIGGGIAGITGILSGNTAEAERAGAAGMTVEEAEKARKLEILKKGELEEKEGAVEKAAKSAADAALWSIMPGGGFIKWLMSDNANDGEAQINEKASEDLRAFAQNIGMTLETFKTRAQSMAEGGLELKEIKDFMTINKQVREKEASMAIYDEMIRDLQQKVTEANLRNDAAQVQASEQQIASYREASQNIAGEILKLNQSQDKYNKKIAENTGKTVDGIDEGNNAKDNESSGYRICFARERMSSAQSAT